MTAYIYLRVSTDDQGISGLGLEAQRANCTKLAEKIGADEIIVYDDIGISGASEIEKRPGLSRILNDIRKGDVLLVAKRDRIAREPRLMGFVEWTLTKRKAVLHSAAGEGSGLPEDDVSGIMQRGMLDLFSKIERAMIRTRTRDAMKAKKARGERVGAVPYGFTLAEDGKHLQEAPHEQEVIKKIHTVYRNLSTRKIASYLNANQIPTRSGNPWTQTQISRILKKTPSQTFEGS